MCSLVLKKFMENAYHEILREFRLSTQRSNLKILLSTGFLESYMLWNGYYQTSEHTQSALMANLYLAQCMLSAVVLMWSAISPVLLDLGNCSSGPLTCMCDTRYCQLASLEIVCLAFHRTEAVLEVTPHFSHLLIGSHSPTCDYSSLLAAWLTFCILGPWQAGGGWWSRWQAGDHRECRSDVCGFLSGAEFLTFFFFSKETKKSPSGQDLEEAFDDVCFRL